MGGAKRLMGGAERLIGHLHVFLRERCGNSFVTSRMAKTFVIV